MKNFEVLDGTMLTNLFRTKGVSQTIQQQWYDIINDEQFRELTFDEIHQKIASLQIDGIDDEIVNLTANTIAMENGVDESSDEMSVCMMIVGKN
ncbi:MAG: hypothetical protein IJ478_00960 [Alistipes sp.]|nr:hypothetical protein [Alistipes sp.]